MNYSDETLGPDYSVGGGINFGPQGITGSVAANVATPGACTTCGQVSLLKGLSLPLLLIAIAVVVLAFRK